jgi:hypothetical protein
LEWRAAAMGAKRNHARCTSHWQFSYQHALIKQADLYLAIDTY